MFCETERSGIQRQRWRLTSAPKSTISVTWLFLSNPKGEHKCSHSFLLGDFSGSVCCSHFGVYHLKGAHNATWTTENTDTESLPSVMMESKMLPLKLHLWTSCELQLVFWFFSPFWFDNKATWPKSLTSGIEIKHHVCLWICGLRFF